MQIVAPGFNEAVLELVWKTTTEIYFEMAGSKGWSGMSSGETVEVPDVPELMLKVSFFREGGVDQCNASLHTLAHVAVIDGSDCAR